MSRKANSCGLQTTHSVLYRMPKYSNLCSGRNPSEIPFPRFPDTHSGFQNLHSCRNGTTPVHYDNACNRFLQRPLHITPHATAHSPELLEILQINNRKSDKPVPQTPDSQDSLLYPSVFPKSGNNATIKIVNLLDLLHPDSTFFLLPES